MSQILQNIQPMKKFLHVHKGGRMQWYQKILSNHNAMVFCGVCDFDIRYFFLKGFILSLEKRDDVEQWLVKDDKDYFLFKKKIHTGCINAVMQTKESDHANKNNPLKEFNQHIFLFRYFWTKCSWKCNKIGTYSSPSNRRIHQEKWKRPRCNHWNIFKRRVWIGVTFISLI